MTDYAIPNFARDDSLRAAVSHALRGGVTLALLALGAALVHATGGAYTYIMVVPILVGALSAGLVAPLLPGPWMPFGVISGTAQTTEQWLIRGFAFALVGGIGGSSSRAFPGRGMFGNVQNTGHGIRRHGPCQQEQGQTRDTDKPENSGRPWSRVSGSRGIHCTRSVGQWRNARVRAACYC